MARKKAKLRSAAIFENLEKLTQSAAAVDYEDQMLDLATVEGQPVQFVADTSKTLRMKKFRAQLLHRWLVNTFEPCRAADVGGGKGLLSHLLNCSGWDTTVIDPFNQPLPDKYKDITTGTRVKIHPDTAVRRIDAAFDELMAAEFDLLIGMHAHGCNAKIIDAAATYGCGFVLFPCCVIDEPFYPRLGVHWLECLASYAVYKGCAVFPFRLNFKGQNIGLCHVGKCRVK
ncbi:MAG: hypothetical protein GX491_05740 [Chloroflexi bacterium]|nr:hypothetical protein [Chloroflexota bacterium]